MAAIPLTAASFGARPLVSLKSSVQLEKQADGSYQIVEATTTTPTWSKTHTETITIEDSASGLASGAQIKYGWSTSTTTEPSTWTTVTLTNYSAGDTTASIEVTNSTLTGKYYLWVKPVNVKDTQGNSATEILKNPYYFDNQVPTITIGNTLTAETLTKDAYGGYITNYTPTNGVNNEGIKWRIFHSDGSNIYLIADTYVPRTNEAGTKNYVPTGYSGTNGRYAFDLYGYSNYNGSADIANNIASKWLKQYTEAGYTATSTNINARATAYLLDTTAWSGFKDSTYADYAVGAPTLELFTASYNKTHGTDIDTGVIQRGYQLKWSGSANYNYYLSGLDTSEDLYVISNTFNNTVTGTLIASPSSRDDDYTIGLENCGVFRVGSSRGITRGGTFC